MSDLNPVIVTLPARTVYGLSMPSADASLPRDIPKLTKSVRAVLPEGTPQVPLYVIYTGYDPAARTLTLAIGAETDAPGLVPITLPQGQYARVTVRPLLGVLWGPAIGKAKGDFYGKWLPTSAFAARNMEYEHHTQASLGKRASIDLYFAIAAR